MTRRRVQSYFSDYDYDGTGKPNAQVQMSHTVDAAIPLSGIPNGNEFLYLTILYAPSGIKRNQYMQSASFQSYPEPTSQTRLGAYYNDEQFSDEDESFSSDQSDFEDSIDNDDALNTECHELGGLEESTKAIPAALCDAAKALSNCAFRDFQNWMSSELYMALPNDRLPPRKRAQISDQNPQPAYTAVLMNSPSSRHLVVTAPTGYFHLACPFYLTDPEKYRGCLLRHDLQSIEEVIRHLRLHHKKPPYCPRCYENFSSVLDRDRHILTRNCETRDIILVDGINEYQQERLWKRDKLCYGETTRWQRIWSTVFPGSKVCPSPYLDHGCGLTVSILRDYWRGHSQKWVSQALEKQHFDNFQSENERIHLILSELILKDLLDKACNKRYESCERHGLEIRLKMSLI